MKRKGSTIRKSLGIPSEMEAAIQRVIDYPTLVYVITIDSRRPTVFITNSRVKKALAASLHKAKLYFGGIDFKNYKLTPARDLRYAAPEVDGTTMFILRDIGGDPILKKRDIKESSFRCTSLEEDIIRPEDYFNLLKKIIESALVKKIIFSKKNAAQVCKSFNRLFYLYNIKFYPDSKPLSGIEQMLSLGFNGAGTLSDKKSTILVRVNPNIKNAKENYDAFVSVFKSLINHEIIHRVQKLRTKLKTEKEKQLEYDDAPDASWEDYLSKSHEAMARAYSTIEEFRLFGYDVAEIKDILKKPDSNLFAFAHRFSPSLFNYLIHTKKDSEGRKKYFKYLYMYLDK